MTEDKVFVERHQISLKEVVITIQSWWKHLIENKKTLLFSSIAFAIIGLIVSFFYNPKFTARTSFVLEGNKKSGLGEYASFAARFGFSSNNGSGLFQDDYNMITFLQSHTMMIKTLYCKALFEGKQELLVKRYFDTYKFNKEWSNDARLANLKFHEHPSERTLLEDSVVLFFCKKIAEKHLSVYKPDKEEAVIEMTMTTIDESFSKFFNEILLENAIRFYIDMQTKRSTENVVILQHQVDSVRGLLNGALVGMAVSSDANPNINPALQRLRVPSQKRLVDVEMNKAILEELVKNLEIARISLRKEMPLVQVIDKPILPLEKTRITKLMGIGFGFLIGFFLSVFILTIKYLYSRLMD